MKDNIALVARWLQESTMNVAFTGAGISTESGIPDFRSPGGVWAKYQPVYFDAFLSDADARLEYWRQKVEAHTEIARAEANDAHRVLAKWEANGHLHGVISQNIDGLHQLAGSRHVLELHGTARQVKCLDCGVIYEADQLVDEFRRSGSVPLCAGCGGRLKHATISFGQSLPEEVLGEATAWCEQCQLLLAMGSSLQVTPAANLPSLAKQTGARVIIVNRDPTALDEMADVVIRDSLAHVLVKIDNQMKG